jgi:hypothetical protein
MDLGYRFSRHKVPRGFSYPMKRTVLDAAIAARGVHSVASVVFYFKRTPESILTVTYTGEQNDGILKPGTFRFGFTQFHQSKDLGFKSQ